MPNRLISHSRRQIWPLKRAQIAEHAPRRRRRPQLQPTRAGSRHHGSYCARCASKATASSPHSSGTRPVGRIMAPLGDGLACFLPAFPRGCFSARIPNKTPASQTHATRSSSNGTARIHSLGIFERITAPNTRRHVSVRQVGQCRTHAKRQSAGLARNLQANVSSSSRS
jgi:hypothetical protein